MSKVLAKDTHVRVSAYDIRVFRAGTTLPKEYEGLVTNPRAFVDGAGSPVEDEPESIRVDLRQEKPAPAGPVDYTKLKKPALVALATERGLEAEGTVKVLAKLLAADDAEKAEAGSGDTELSTLDEAALRELATERKVDVSDATSTEEIIALLENASGE